MRSARDARGVRGPCLALLLVARVASASDAGPLPPGSRLVWASNREDGRHEVYAQQAGAQPLRLTRRGGRMPAWSPDGELIAYVDTSDLAVHLMRPDGSGDRAVCAELPAFADAPPFFFHAAHGLVCGRRLDDGDTAYEAQRPASGSRLLFKKSDFSSLSTFPFAPSGITADGRLLVGWVIDLFKDGHEAANGVFRSAHSTVLLELPAAAQPAPPRLFYVGAGCLSAVPQRGSVIYHVSRESPTYPDIYRFDVEQVATRAGYSVEVGAADAQWGHEYMPSISNDGAWLAFAASTGCHHWHDCDYEIFIHRVGDAAAQRTRVTFHSGNDNFPGLFVEPAPAAPADAGVAARRDAAATSGGGAAAGCSVGHAIRGAGLAQPWPWVALALLGWRRRRRS